MTCRHWGKPGLNFRNLSQPWPTHLLRQNSVLCMLHHIPSRRCFYPSLLTSLSLKITFPSHLGTDSSWNLLGQIIKCEKLKSQEASHKLSEPRKTELTWHLDPDCQGGPAKDTRHMCSRNRNSLFRTSKKETSTVSRPATATWLMSCRSLW